MQNNRIKKELKKERKRSMKRQGIGIEIQTGKNQGKRSTINAVFGAAGLKC